MSSQIQKYHKDLLEKIPLSQHLGVKIMELTDLKVILSTPLSNNINYQGTVFGGSLNAVAVLSCYLMLHHLLNSRKINFSSLVIQSSEIKYLLPTTSDFECICELPDKKIVDHFLHSLEKNGRARFQLNASERLNESGPPLVNFTGNFVVKK